MTYSKINDLNLHNGPLSVELNNAARRVISSGWFALGPEVKVFEQEFAQWVGADHCIGVASGTDALEIGLRALGVDKESNVIVAANAGMYSTTAILAIGASPIYADINPDTFCIDPKDVSQKITNETKVIIATHLYGRLCDMEELAKLAKQHGIGLLEDCAQAHGASLNNKKAGSWGDASAFSFYPTKNLGALGDGGAVVTNQKKIIDDAACLRQYGWEGKYKVVKSGGCNSRLDEMQAAFLRVKLSHLDGWTKKRQQLGKYYSSAIAHPHVGSSDFVEEEHAYHLYVVQSSKRDILKTYLQEKGIAVDIHYPLLDYQQPIFSGQSVSQTVLPVSEEITNKILTIPCYPELSIEDAQFVCDAINQWKI